MKPSVKQGIALGALLTMLVSGGCKVGSDYCAPQATVNSTYLQVDQAKGIRQQVGADVSTWWSQIQDPILTRLTCEAVSNNLTLREALYRIQAARATLGATQAAGKPQFAESGGYTYGRSSNTQSDYNDYAVATSMAWEIDVFGRLERSVEAANADMEELRELYRNAYVILCADVAQCYINARAYQEQIRISEENIEIQQSTLEITQTKNQFGSASKLDENQALGVCRGTEASVLTLQTQYQQTLNQISILVGRPPGYVDELMRAPAPIPSAPEDIMVGIPADLLRRRPDIRAAEQRIIAQNARVGVAIGDLYPIFSLNGSFGLDADSLSDMFNSDAINASVGPSFRWNILNFGRYRFNVEAQRLVQEQLITAYRQAVLEAAQDVDNALASYCNERDRLETLSDAVDAYTDAYELSNERYKSGQIDFQRLLDSQAGKLSYELQYIQCRASMMSSVVQLYRSLGGDWMGSTYTSAADYAQGGEYAPTLQAGQGSSQRVLATDSNDVGPVSARYTTKDEDAPLAYNPDAEWNERRERSRQRVAIALQQDDASTMALGSEDL
ncbi:MAG: efflux transporter outer membrane subunit [Planctomycetia bacterium]|nr:efflux transporter outer membrane subunit [Planctomycetia bacterium]